jgi:hypothetical protein
MPPGLSPCRSARRDEYGTPVGFRRLRAGAPQQGDGSSRPPLIFIARTLCSNGRTEIPVWRLQPNRFETATFGVFNLYLVWVILALFLPRYLFGCVGLLAEVPRAAAIDVFARFASRQYYVSSFTIMFRQNV